MSNWGVGNTKYFKIQHEKNHCWIFHHACTILSQLCICQLVSIIRLLVEIPKPTIKYLPLNQNYFLLVGRQNAMNESITFVLRCPSCALCVITINCLATWLFYLNAWRCLRNYYRTLILVSRFRTYLCNWFCFIVRL